MVALYSLIACTIGASPDLSAKAAILTIDRHYQAVFRDLELTKPLKVKYTSPNGKVKYVTGRMAFFGRSRMDIAERIEGGHGMLNVVPDHRGTGVRAGTAVRGWFKWQFLVGNRTRKFDPNTAIVDAALGNGLVVPEMPQDAIPTKEIALQKLREAKDFLAEPMFSTRMGWVWAVSPIRLKDKSCLSCHTQSKFGEPAGVMIYAIHKKPWSE